MASSTPTQYPPLTTAKPHQNPLKNHPSKPPKSSHRPLLSSSSSSSSPSIVSPCSSSTTTNVSTGCCSTATADPISTTFPSPSSRNAIKLNPGCQPFYPACRPRPRVDLGPDFRRSRTTRVISKRNLSSPKSSHTRTTSLAAADCAARIARSSADDHRAVSRILSSFQPNLIVPEDYCCVLHELGDRNKCPTKALRFFHSALPLMRNPTDQGKLLTAAISSLGKMGRHDLAKEVFDAGVMGGYGSTVFAYSALISAYAKSGLSAEAMAVFESMKALGLRPNIISYNALIDACGKGGVDLRSTTGFFREMLYCGVVPDRKTFNSLLAACSRAGHLEQARMMFDEMIRLGVGRDIYTYNTFIDAVCKCGNMELAVEVMGDMSASKLRPNVVTYSTLMDGYSKLEQFDEALSLYEEMKQKKIRLDRVCYNTLLSIYVKTGRYEEIARVSQEMNAMGIDKDTVTYNSLIHGYGKQGRFNVVACLIQDMRERGIAPTVLTYSTLIDIYSKAGMYGEAANVFMEFRESGLKADVVLYSSFIDTLAKNGLVECAAWLLEEMTKIGIEPNVVTYNAIIDGFGKSRIFAEEGCVGNDTVGAEGCNHQVIRAFDQLARGIGRPLTEVVTRRSEELFCILGLFQKMVQQGIRPNVVTFSAILNACSHCNSFKDASLLLEQLRLFDNFVYGVAHGLLMGFREARVHAHSLFDELKRMDPATSSAFYNALTDMLWHFGQKRGAQQVVLEGVHRQVWENTWSEFSLDLHLMSSGAAQAMVHAWLLNIHAIVFEGRPLPAFVSILTGWGKHSKVVGASTLRRVIEALLNSIGAPFHIERFNIGRFVSPGAVVAAWLRESGTLSILLLHDQRAQQVNLPNLIPGLQALQL